LAELRDGQERLADPEAMAGPGAQWIAFWTFWTFWTAFFMARRPVRD
jgi:hypothetical protein